MKKLIVLLLLLATGCLLVGCLDTQSPQLVIPIGREISGLMENANYTIVNNAEEERFEISYKGTNGEKDFTAFFTFELYVFGDYEGGWSSYDKTHDENLPLALSCESGNLIEKDRGYDVVGETTVCVSYAALPEDLKNLCKSYPESKSTIDQPIRISIYINGYHVVADN